MNNPTIFFRNDDVRDRLDESLVVITNLFIKHNIPITHAVEPANVTRPVIEWLLNTKEKNPGLIEIVQHGYEHKLNAVNGEFGGTRRYKDQHDDIKKGKELMDIYFGNHWFPAFTFPYGSYNYETLLVLQDLDYKVVSTGYTHSIKRVLLNNTGVMLRKKFLMNKPINYFNEKIPGLNLLELPTMLNLSKKAIDEDNAIQKSFAEVKREFEALRKSYSIIGLLMHHRWWKGDDFTAMDSILTYLKESNYNFLTLEKMCTVFTGDKALKKLKESYAG